MLRKGSRKRAEPTATAAVHPAFTVVTLPKREEYFMAVQCGQLEPNSCAPERGSLWEPKGRRGSRERARVALSVVNSLRIFPFS